MGRTRGKFLPAPMATIPQSLHTSRGRRTRVRRESLRTRLFRMGREICQRRGTNHLSRPQKPRGRIPETPPKILRQPSNIQLIGTPRQTPPHSTPRKRPLKGAKKAAKSPPSNHQKVSFWWPFTNNGNSCRQQRRKKCLQTTTFLQDFVSLHLNHKRM